MGGVYTNSNNGALIGREFVVYLFDDGTNDLVSDLVEMPAANCTNMPVLETDELTVGNLIVKQ